MLQGRKQIHLILKKLMNENQKEYGVKYERNTNFIHHRREDQQTVV